MSYTKSGVGSSQEKIQRSGVQLFERLASLCSMRPQLNDPLKLFEQDSTMVSRGLRGGCQLGPDYAGRSEPLGQPG